MGEGKCDAAGKGNARGSGALPTPIRIPPLYPSPFVTHHTLSSPHHSYPQTNGSVTSRVYSISGPIGRPLGQPFAYPNAPTVPPPLPLALLCSVLRTPYSCYGSPRPRPPGSPCPPLPPPFPCLPPPLPPLLPPPPPPSSPPPLSPFLRIVLCGRGRKPHWAIYVGRPAPHRPKKTPKSAEKTPRHQLEPVKCDRAPGLEGR